MLKDNDDILKDKDSALKILEDIVNKDILEIKEPIKKEEKFKVYSFEILETEIRIGDRRILFKSLRKSGDSILIYECKFNSFTQVVEQKHAKLIKKKIASLEELEHFAIEYAKCQDII